MENGLPRTERCRLELLDGVLRQRRVLRGQRDPEDAVQDVCLRILERVPRWQVLSQEELERQASVILERGLIDQLRRSALIGFRVLDERAVAATRARHEVCKQASKQEPAVAVLVQEGEDCVLRWALASERVRAALTAAQLDLLRLIADGFHTDQALADLTGRKPQAVQQMRQRIRTNLDRLAAEN